MSRGRPRMFVTLVQTSVHLTPEQVVQLRRLGGSAWLRGLIETEVERARQVKGAGVAAALAAAMGHAGSGGS